MSKKFWHQIIILVLPEKGHIEYQNQI